MGGGGYKNIKPWKPKVICIFAELPHSFYIPHKMNKQHPVLISIICNVRNTFWMLNSRSLLTDLGDITTMVPTTSLIKDIGKVGKLFH